MSPAGYIMNAQLFQTPDAVVIFSDSRIVNVNGTYGPNQLRPISIIGGRLFKFSVDVDY